MLMAATNLSNIPAKMKEGKTRKSKVKVGKLTQENLWLHTMHNQAQPRLHIEQALQGQSAQADWYEQQPHQQVDEEDHQEEGQVEEGQNQLQVQQSYVQQQQQQQHQQQQEQQQKKVAGTNNHVIRRKGGARRKKKMMEAMKNQTAESQFSDSSLDPSPSKGRASNKGELLNGSDPSLSCESHKQEEKPNFFDVEGFRREFEAFRPKGKSSTNSKDSSGSPFESPSVSALEKVEEEDEDEEKESKCAVFQIGGNDSTSSSDDARKRSSSDAPSTLVGEGSGFSSSQTSGSEGMGKRIQTVKTLIDTKRPGKGLGPRRHSLPCETQKLARELQSIREGRLKFNDEDCRRSSVQSVSLKEREAIRAAWKKSARQDKRRMSMESLEHAQESFCLAVNLMEMTLGNQRPMLNMSAVNESSQLTRAQATLLALAISPDTNNNTLQGERDSPTQTTMPTLKRSASQAETKKEKKEALRRHRKASPSPVSPSNNPFALVPEHDLKGSYLVQGGICAASSTNSLNPAAKASGPGSGKKAKKTSETALLLNNHKFLRPENLIEKDLRLLQDYDNPIMLAKATRALQEHVRDVTERTKNNCCMGNKQVAVSRKENVPQVSTPLPQPLPVRNSETAADKNHNVELSNGVVHSPVANGHPHRHKRDSPNDDQMPPQSGTPRSQNGTPRSHASRRQGTPNSAAENAHYIIDETTGTTYLRGKLLGKGGFAKCYEMTDVKTNVSYAGKIISKSRLNKPHQKEKILREIELHKSLYNRNVVAFHSYFEDGDNVYIILEMCRRKSLVHVLKNRRTLTEPEVRYYMKQLIEGTRYIHEAKVIHRDLKLGNMLLNDHMQVKIADFGLATKVEYEGEKKMTVCGTPNYIAPEVLQKKGHSFEADVWAMGCVMYAMLVGRPPFETSTLKETYLRITSNQYYMPSHLSPAARTLIQHLLHPDPSKRPDLNKVLFDDFFTSGFLPKKLPTSCCDTAPVFPANTNYHDNHKSPRPRSYAAPVSSTEAMNKLTSSLAHLKGSRKSASQIITRTKTPDTDGTQAGHGGTEDSSPLKRQCGSTPANMNRQGAQGSCQEIRGLPFASPVRLYQLLTTCLEHMPKAPASVCDVGVDNIQPALNPNKPLWVTKWVDYSNKYGFGFQLSDKSVGILFNDTTRMLLTPDGKTVQYNDLSNKVFTFCTDSAPSEYQKKVTLLMYFAQYMDEHLIHGGDMLHHRHGNQEKPVPVIETRDPPSGIFMKKWFRTARAIVMYLNNGTLQVNFFEDHTKVILSPENHDYLLTYVNNSRTATTYKLLQLCSFGCSEDVAERLNYSRRMLENIINIEGEAV